MGMAAISVMSWPPIRTARLVFFKREPPHSGHGTVALFLIRLPRSAISPRPLQRGQAPSGLLNENSPGVISGADAPQFRQTNFWLNAISRPPSASFSEGIRTLII